MSRIATPLLAGLLFGAGLVVSGMVDPVNVLGFLALGPGWNPSLGFVFCGALLVTMPSFFWLRRRTRPVAASHFVTPPTRPIDRRLIGGAALFGLGWGLAGFCPGPAVVSAGLLQGVAWLFIPAFLLGGKIAGSVK